ncbi:hypothetical protein SLEP1_g3740 [Rubroshorea leprosula]|uniref:Uncharacterized protein n=1 Tax=Rubroshorea leprosula TaxID=152421 RepID=A0AAV5HSX3_9ROSI|nr:hypothetical protein SLEP1_g3740 [Rubroshorea leprosula]
MSSSISFPRRLPSQPDLVLLAGRFWVVISDTWGVGGATN